MEITEQTLTSHPFLSGLAPAHIAMVSREARLQRFGVGELIFQERHDADHLYLLHRGSVALEGFLPGQGVVTLQTLSAGDALGWSWLFPPYHWQFSARSLDATEVVAIRAVVLRDYAVEHPDFGTELLSRMVQVLLTRLKATRVKLQELRDPGLTSLMDGVLTAQAESEPEQAF